MNDYRDGDLTNDGFYLVHYAASYGRYAVPAGPYPTLKMMVEKLQLSDYPERGYLVQVIDGQITTIPSLDPDELWRP